MAIPRYAKITAKPGGADDIERVLLGAAASLESSEGCLLYIISRQHDDVDIVWVTELWRDQAALDAGRAAASADPTAAAAMANVQSWEMIELDLVGGKVPAA
jgi:quinol monooxygenase YgiN